MSPDQITLVALAGTVGLPAVGAFVARRLASPRALRIFGVTTSLLALAVSLAVAIAGGDRAALRVLDVPLARVDPIATGMLPVAALIVVAILVGLTRTSLTPARVAHLLGGLAAASTLYLAAHLLVLAAAFSLVLIPLAIEARGARGARPRWLLVLGASGGATTLLLALLWLSRLQSGAADPGGFAPRPSSPFEGAIVIAILAAVLVRKGVFPVHGWIMPAVVHAPDAVLLPLLTAHTGGFLLMRLYQVAPDTLLAASPALAAIGATGAIYGAVLGLAQRDLRRWVAALSVSYGGVILMGLSAGNVEGITGGLTQWLTLSLVSAGLTLAIAFVERRAGGTTPEQSGGISQRAPYLSRAFLFFGLAGAGIPGTLGFVGEDLLVHGVLETHPIVSAIVVLTTVVNAIAFYRGYSLCLTGPPRVSPRTPPTLARERWALGVLAVALVATGLVPSAVVHAREQAAREFLGLGPAPAREAAEHAAAPEPAAADR